MLIHSRSGDLLRKIGEERIAGWGSLDCESGVMLKTDSWGCHTTVPSAVIQHLVNHHWLRGYDYLPAVIAAEA
jgi:hypothetical protein